MSARPVVGFAMRAHLAPTETFVDNQLRTLSRYHAVVLAHRRRADTHAPLRDGAIGRELLAPALGQIDAGLHRATRMPLPQAVAALARHARERDARLLHFHYLTDARMLLGLRRRTGLPSVVSGYGYDVSSFPRAAHGLGLRWMRPVFEELDLFLAMSPDMREDLLALGCPPEKVRVHYYGSETARFRTPARDPAPDRPLTVLCCGRLYEGKAQHLVLAALRRVYERGTRDFRVVLVGDGPLRPRLEAQVADYGWEDRVRFCGHVRYDSEELVAHFRDADVFAHPSFTFRGVKEGIPGTIVEAMAAGLPVVATWHAGIPAVIDDGRSGLLVGERDVDALAEALDALLTDAQLRRRLGAAAAHRAAAELDLHARTPHLERRYDELLGGAVTPPPRRTVRRRRAAAGATARG